jgi:hypothetical protein
MVISFIRPSIRKEEGMTIYSIYKNNHPVTPPQVVNVLDLGYLGVETDFPEQLSALPYKKKRNQDLYQEEKEYNRIHAKKKDSDRTCFVA